MDQPAGSGKVPDGWISVTDAGASVALGSEELSSPPRESDLGPQSLQERDGPCSREGEAGLESAKGRSWRQGWEKRTSSMSACLGWLPAKFVPAIFLFLCTG